MSNNIVVKIVIALVVAVLVYSVFWFFKVGQLEKQVNKFISENSANVSAEEVSVSGFPLSQKVTIKNLRFTLPNALLNKRTAVVKHLEARGGIFSSEFSVVLLEPVTVQDSDNNVGTVEFGQDPVISIALSDGRISKFNYQDTGYRILDADKNVIYAASNTQINIDSTMGEGDKITTKIMANIKDIEGFNILDVYKNVLEKRIVDGIKTGEIAIGNASTALIPAQVIPVATTPVPAVPATPVANGAAPAAMPVVPTDVAATPAAVPAEAVPASVTDSSLVKNNFMLDAEYVITPNQEQQAQIPLDPTQIQEAPTQFSKVVRVKNLEFSNPLFKINLNGEMSVTPDDSMPFGVMSIKVEKIDAMIGQITAGFTQMAEQKKQVAGVQTADLTGNGMPSEDAYQNFLQRIATNFGGVAKELAAKNAVTKEDVAQFDVRREKNLDFLVNETTIREILGKF